MRRCRMIVDGCFQRCAEERVFIYDTYRRFTAFVHIAQQHINGLIDRTSRTEPREEMFRFALLCHYQFQCHD